jgi:hypothetical protein
MLRWSVGVDHVGVQGGVEFDVREGIILDA